MPALTHKSKVRIAKRLKAQTGDSKPMFETDAWEARKKQIRARVKKREENSRLVIKKEKK